MSRVSTLLGAVLLAGCAATPSPTIPPSPSLTVSPSPSPSPSLTAAFPTEILGLPVVTVSDLLELAATDDRPGEVLAVKGWYTPPVALSCPSPQTPQALLQLGCGDSTSALTEYPERVMTIGPYSWSGHAPTGPSLVPKVIWPSNAIYPDADWDGRPFPAVLVGHIGDERAALCSPEALATCLDTFVVDRIAWFAGAEPALVLELDELVGHTGQLPTAADANAMVASLPYHGTVLSMAILGADTVRHLEPTFGYDGRAPLVYVRVAADPCGLASRFGQWSSVPMFFTLDGEPTLERPCGTPAGTDLPWPSSPPTPSARSSPPSATRAASRPCTRG